MKFRQLWRSSAGVDVLAVASFPSPRPTMSDPANPTPAIADPNADPNADPDTSPEISPDPQADANSDAPAEPKPSYVKLAMRNMVRKGGQSLLHFGLTTIGLLGVLVGLAYLTR